MMIFGVIGCEVKDLGGRFCLALIICNIWFNIYIYGFKQSLILGSDIHYIMWYHKSTLYRL